MTSRYYLECLWNMPDSKQKLYKLIAVEGSSKTMQAVSREYARMVRKGYRMWRGELGDERK